MVCPSLTPSEALRSLSDDIRAEDALIAGRVTWYVTSQAFLLTAHATSWTYGFLWRSFFHLVLPLASVALSVLIFSSITAATWAQEVYLREQMRLVSEIRARLELSLPEALALDAYARTLVANRRTAEPPPAGPWAAAFMQWCASHPSRYRSDLRCCGCTLSSTHLASAHEALTRPLADPA